MLDRRAIGFVLGHSGFFVKVHLPPGGERRGRATLPVMLRPLPAVLAIVLLAASCGDGPAGADGVVQDGEPPDLLRPDGPSPVADGGPADAPSPDGSLPARYGPTTHSPITPHVAANLRAIAQRDPTRNGRVFSKIGNSITVSSFFLHCLAQSSVDLGSHQALSPTHQHFRLDLGGGATSYDRQSLCAVIGWPAHNAIAGSPSPLEQEVAAISPRFAVVMYGTNDIGWDNIWQYAGAMLSITDQLIAGGVIPLLTLIPPRDDSASADLQVPRYNAVVRGIGQARQVQVIDLHRELMPLDGHGMASDGLHLDVTGGGCDFSAAGLQHGFNIRNLLTLQALDRARRVVLDQAPAPDPPGAVLAGDGTKAAPFVIDGLPFTDLRDTMGWGQRAIDSYGCAPSTDESGPEYFYRLELKQPTAIRAMAFDGDGVDIDLHLLGGSIGAAGCIARGDKLIIATLQPGTYHLALDTYVKSGVEQAGEYLVVVVVD